MSQNARAAILNSETGDLYLFQGSSGTPCPLAPDPWETICGRPIFEDGNFHRQKANPLAGPIDNPLESRARHYIATSRLRERVSFDLRPASTKERIDDGVMSASKTKSGIEAILPGNCTATITRPRSGRYFLEVGATHP